MTDMIEVGGRTLSLEDFSKIIFAENQVQLSSKALERIDKNFEFLQQFSTEKIIYGINTGFGPMAQYRVNEDKTLQLQYNLIRSHCSGSGKPLSMLLCKAVTIARLNSLMQGYSGIHNETVELLATLINKNIVPVIYEHGGVGASGDLVQLAHLALTLIGEGEVYCENEIKPTADVFYASILNHLTFIFVKGLPYSTALRP